MNSTHHLTARKTSRLLRKLKHESLESRRVLATVTTLVDIVDADDGLTSLREAITEATPMETIDFAIGGTIHLDQTLGELSINKSLTIDGNNEITIDAGLGGDGQMNGNGIRIFNIDSGGEFTQDDVQISGLTLTGADVDGFGGAIYSRERLTLARVTISGNSATELGGGIRTWANLEIRESTISDNSASSNSAISLFSGGRAAGRILTLSDTIVSGNTKFEPGNQGAIGFEGYFNYQSEVNLIRSEVQGNDGNGLSVRFTDLNVEQSTISGNRAFGLSSFNASIYISESIISDNFAGGISGSNVIVNVSRSSISGNGNLASGQGGISTRFADTTVLDSTISDNRASGNGGGINTNYGVTISNSTISGNQAAELGGGVWAGYWTTSIENSTFTGNIATSGGAAYFGRYFIPTVNISNSIFAENTNHSDMGDIGGESEVILNASHSLIGSTVLPIQGDGNLIGLPAQLLPLADNGGPTLTHALDSSSPAIDSGQSLPDSPTYDQRGMGFDRIAGAGMDMGAFEFQSLIPPDGDFNEDGAYDCHDINALTNAVAEGMDLDQFDITADGLVNSEDIAAWLIEAGANNLGAGSRFLIGDANLDGFVDTLDFNLWNRNKFTTNTAWCAGNFAPDTEIDVADFNLWNANRFQSGISPPAVKETPWLRPQSTEDNDPHVRANAFSRIWSIGE